MPHIPTKPGNYKTDELDYFEVELLECGSLIVRVHGTPGRGPYYIVSTPQGEPTSWALSRGAWRPCDLSFQDVLPFLKAGHFCRRDSWYNSDCVIAWVAPLFKEYVGGPRDRFPDPFLFEMEDFEATDWEVHTFNGE